MHWARQAKFSHTLVWPLKLGLRTPTLRCGHLSGPLRTRGGFFDFEVGGHDGAYNGRVHVIVPFVGHLALEYTRAKEETHRFFIESAHRLQESAWLVQRHTLHRHAHRRVLQRQLHASLQSKENLVYSAWMRTRLQGWRSGQSAECAARFRLSVHHVAELERATRCRLTGQYDADTHTLSRWRHKRPRLHWTSPPPPKTATLHGTGYTGAARGYATHGNPLGRLGGCHHLDWIVTTRLICCGHRPRLGTDRGDTRRRTRSNRQPTLTG